MYTIDRINRIRQVFGKTSIRLGWYKPGGLSCNSHLANLESEAIHRGFDSLGFIGQGVRVVGPGAYIGARLARLEVSLGIQDVTPARVTPEKIIAADYYFWGVS